MKKKDLYRQQGSIIQKWVNERENMVKRDSTTLLAFLSLVLPFFRVDRHYFVREHNLSSVLARAMGMSVKSAEEFKQWRTTDGDFGLMFENSLKQRVYILRQSYVNMGASVLKLIVRGFRLSK